MKAYELISCGQRWWPGAACFARTVDGEQCTIDSPDAYQFGMLGALAKVYNNCFAIGITVLPEYEKLFKTLRAHGHDVHHGEIITWELGATFQDIHRALKEADL